MARMIPNIDLLEIENAGEREMYRRLRDQLPASWLVRYHFPACWLDGLHLRECECDFIVLAPGRGLMLVEVKGIYTPLAWFYPVDITMLYNACLGTYIHRYPGEKGRKTAKDAENQRAAIGNPCPKGRGYPCQKACGKSGNLGCYR